MIRHALFRLVVCLAVEAGFLVDIPVAATAATAQSGLSVTIDTLTPAVVPTRGPVTITGQITNNDSQPWTDLKVYLLRSPIAMTTSTEVAAAAALPDDAEPPGASRITTSGRYDDAGALAPGASTGYSVSVPRRLLALSGAAGVYWFGVQVLGTQNGARDSLADARAHTFLPLVPAKTPPVRLALVLPFVDPVHRTRNGTLLNAHGWQATLAPDGRLNRLLALSSSTAQPVTWLVDPAVLDAVTSVSDGNPPFALSTTSGGVPSATPSASPSASPSPANGGGPAPPTRDERDATAWLGQFTAQAAQRNVLALPYADVDAAAAFTHGYPELLSSAESLGAQTLRKAGISASTALVPQNGYLPQSVIDAAPQGTTVILRDTALPSKITAFLTPAGTTVVRTDDAAASGGPGPGPRLSALAVRQRVLSEAALRALSPDVDRPLVVTLPFHWDPGSEWAASDFFAAFTQPWLQMTPLGELGVGTSPPEVSYPAAAHHGAVPAANLRASQDLGRAGSILATLLTGNRTIGNQVLKASMLAATQQSRVRQRAAARQVEETRVALRRLMRRVRIDGPPFVMMSSERGPIQVTLVNGLTVPVTVAVRAHAADAELSILPPHPVTIAPGARAPVRLRVVGHELGVHVVTVEAVDSRGNPLGAVVTFNVRTSQVGQIIWVIVGAGGVLLFGAIGVRLVRRIRRRTRFSDPRAGDPPPSDGPSGSPDRSPPPEASTP